MRDSGVVHISPAGEQDLPHLAHLLWLHAAPHEQRAQSVESFATDLHRWWSAHDHSHVAFVARRTDSQLVGMAWVALLPRVPRPGAMARFSADIQSVFVLEEERGKGVGSRLVLAATEHARTLGATTVTVQSGRRAVPVYERLGFSSSPQLLQRPVDRGYETARQS